MPQDTTAVDGTTIADVLKRAFPVPYPVFPAPPRAGGKLGGVASPPLMPFDVFAICAHLLEISGAYHHILAKMPGRPKRVERQVNVTDAILDETARVAQAWRELDLKLLSPRKEKEYSRWIQQSGIRNLFEWWRELFVGAGDSLVFQQLVSQSPPPHWWELALKLLMAADQAAAGAGFEVPIDPDAVRKKKLWFDGFLGDWFGYQLKKAEERVGGKREDAHHPVSITGFRTLSAMAGDLGAVLPKARTPSVGCTVRSLSHHLALLPPRGVARGLWLPYAFSAAPPDEGHLNLLLIPFPYSIPAQAFGQACRETDCRVPWGFFEVSQAWLKPFSESTTRLVTFVEALIREAEKQVDQIHGIVFPELSLDDRCYGALETALPRTFKSLELLIAGVSRKTTDRRGNFVRMSLFQKDADGGEREHLWSEREKHHRWKLDAPQIKAYALEGRLSPAVGWWEDIDLMSRRVDFAVFRRGSVITGMICEDLARIDPCQELIRAIGPSLVVALLMDAPQLKVRWPARYATILAEDPGSAVLTLTSRGLMTRQHRFGSNQSRDVNDRAIALWRDDLNSEPKELACGLGAQAIRLTVFGTKVVDCTLDGRTDETAVAWRYANHAPVSLPNGRTEYADILGEDDQFVNNCT